MKIKQPLQKGNGCYSIKSMVYLKELAPVVFNGCFFAQAFKPV